MTFALKFTTAAADALLELRSNKSQDTVRKAVEKALGYMQVNLKHPGLRTHEFTSLSAQFHQKVFETYAQNRTPGAYRIFWHYGPGKDELTVIAITPHP